MSIQEIPASELNPEQFIVDQVQQIGIDPQEVFGYQIIEPLIQLRKDGVRQVAQAVGLPESVYNRMPFPGPALTACVGGAGRGQCHLPHRAQGAVNDGGCVSQAGGALQ